MKLITFTSYKQQTRIGAITGNDVIDSLDIPQIPLTMLEFLAQGETALFTVQQQIESGSGRIALDAVKLLAPIPNP